MPTFEYQAVRTDGRSDSGRVDGASLDEALAELGRQGLNVLKIEVALNPHDIPSPIATGPELEAIQEERSYLATNVWGPVVGKVSLTNLSFFFRQLGTMLSAGVPFVQTLDTLGRQSRDLKMRGIIGEMRENVAGGRPMSAAMRRYPEVFSPVMISLVRAGEASGLLDKTVHTIADYIDQEIKLRNLYRRSTFYPKMQLVLSIVIILFANGIIGSISATAQQLSSPLTTWATWIVLGPLVVGGFLFVRIGLANPKIKYQWDMVTSMLPYLGPTLRQFAMAKFGRAFCALYKGGVPIGQAVSLSADSCGNEYLRARMQPAARALETGTSIAETFRASGAFSPIVLDMVATGETSGNLETMLSKMAEFYEGESETRMQQFAVVVGTLIGLAVMLYIAMIIIGFWSGFGQSRVNV